MREILFRGKSTDTGAWVYGYYCGPFGDFDEHEICDIADPTCSRVDVDPETVGQYTGLKDINGKQIFEGDIVRWASANTYLTSNYVYDRKAYGYGSVLIVTSLASGFTLRQIKDNAPDIPNANRKIDNYSFWNHQGQLEVIGNIHDNPELIGRKEE